MPTRIAAHVISVDAGKMHKIDTRNAENLFGMWTVFSKCAESLENGRRLENLSWRIWNRETLLCESGSRLASAPTTGFERPTPTSKDVPELSASVESAVSEEDDSIESRCSNPVNIKRPSGGMSQSMESRSGGRSKHITSLRLEKMVYSITERSTLEPLSPSIAEAVPTLIPSSNITPRATSPAPQPAHDASNSSSSTDSLSSPESNSRATNIFGSDTSAELITSHSVVRGFSPSHVSSSYRSHTNLAAAAVAAKSIIHKPEDSKKGGAFFIGGSSGEDESSFDERMSSQQPQSSLTANLAKPNSHKKQTSFKDEVESRTINHRVHEDEEVFESDDDVSESAIEDEEDDSDWEDSPNDSPEPSVNDQQLFQRVDSRPDLTSRRSLLTKLIHEPDRAAALARMASKSTPAMQRSRTSSPNGPSVASSPEEESTLSVHGSKPIIMTTSNTHPPALSPRTTRRNMLATELTESLRKHLLWERQQKTITANAVLKRRHTAQDVAHLQRFPNGPGSGSTSKTNSWNHYFDHGLGEYHQKGW
ncbi:hypothetical protein MMC20_000763 [Loxospora ochrophaea]|nr:hypothetical protein [Loxospora ochrophaea]